MMQLKDITLLGLSFFSRAVSHLGRRLLGKKINSEYGIRMWGCVSRRQAHTQMVHL